MSANELASRGGSNLRTIGSNQDRQETRDISGSGSSPGNNEVDMMWMRDPNKQVIEPNHGNSFKPNPTNVVHKIVKIMTSKFDEPWKSWKQIPREVRDLWFDELKKQYQWHPQHARQIRKNFESRGCNRLKDMLSDARQNNKCPIWMEVNVWRELQVYWKSPDFLKKSEQAKKNRSSDVDGLGASLHTGGSIPMTEHKRRMEIREGKEILDVDLFLATHQKKDKSWVDNRSKKTYEKWSNAWKNVEMSQETDELGSESSVKFTQDELWARNNKTKKGTIYGLGAEGGKYKTSTPRYFIEPSYMEEQLNKEKKMAEEIESLREENLHQKEETKRLKEENSKISAQMEVMMDMLNSLQKRKKKKDKNKSKKASTST